MKRVVLPGTSLSVSRFAFGTASLYRIGGLSDQVAHLRAAAEQGFTHFDSAPIYGFGSAETALGEAFGDEQKITIATKVGLYPPGGAEQGRLSMLARKVAGKVAPSFSKPTVDFAVARARDSFARSLQRLRRDRVDLLLLHEPDIGIINSEEWQRWRDDEGDRIGAIGVSGPGSVVLPFVVDQHAVSEVIQVRDSVATKEADCLTNAGRETQLTYGYLSSNAGDSDPEAILRQALSRNPKGSVLVTTRQRSRLSTFARLSREEG